MGTVLSSWPMRPWVTAGSCPVGAWGGCPPTEWRTRPPCRQRKRCVKLSGVGEVGDGGGGAGILPIMLASYTDFMRAEAALASNNTSGAASALNSAMTKSIAKTQSFISLDPSADSTFAPTSGEVSSFISGVISSFNSGNANAKWEILATQQFIGNFGSGIGAYNLYRRTGYPKLIQFNIDPNPGAFVRSFFYPSNEANVNSNITQKPNVDVQVFWDTNPASPGFPSAN